MVGKGASAREAPAKGGTTMRAIKILTVAITMAGSLVVGLAGSASAAPAPKAQPLGLWCC
jgi:hypothetical protein